MNPPAHIAQLATDDAAVQAIASVLQAERDAHLAVAQAQAEADRLVDAARAGARAVAERAERRSRAVASAFDRLTAVRVSEIDRQAAVLAQAPAWDDAEAAGLTAAVQRLAQSLTGSPP